MKITKSSDKRLKTNDKFNNYHYAVFCMSEEAIEVFIEELKNNHYHFYIDEINKKTDHSIFRLHIRKGKRHNFNKEKFDKLSKWDYGELKCFYISWIDNRKSDRLFKILDNIKMGMQYTGSSGGWDATPYYLVGNIKDEKFKRALNLYKNEQAYFNLKHLNDKKNKFYKKKEKLEEIENYLKEFKMSDKEIHDYIVKPNEYLFQKTVIETILLDQEDGLINMLKAKLGYPDAKPF